MSPTEPPHSVLVTGASGFLGGHLVRELREHGHEVYAAGRNVEALGRVADEGHRVVGDLSRLPGCGVRVDAVVHCAALSSPWGRWRDFREANVEGTRHVVDYVRGCGARRLVHVSSPSVYAAPRDREGIREEEADPDNRLNGYIRSKILAERLLQDALRAGELPELVVLRPRGLIGAGDPSLLPRMLAAHERTGLPLIEDGAARIDLTAVENVAHALRLALTRGDAAGGVYNISNDDPRSFRALLERLLGLLGRPARWRRFGRRRAWLLASALEAACRILPGRPEPPLTRYTLTTIAYTQTLDVSRARRDLGYAPRLGLDEALEAIAADLRGAA